MPDIDIVVESPPQHPEDGPIPIDTSGQKSTAGKTKRVVGIIMTLAFKTVNALFLCRTFLYFMLYEKDPLSVLEALTYQGMVLLCLHSISSLVEEGLAFLQGEWSQFFTKPQMTILIQA